MSLAATSVNLEDTVTARWRRRLSGDPLDGKGHWRTRTGYYRAANELVASGQSLSWRTIVSAVRPRGSKSTFYEVAGAHARHTLIGDLVDDGRLDSIQLALCYRRGGAVEQLLDETKVWSFWPDRDRLVALYEAVAMPPDTKASILVQALCEWASGNPRLAATLDHAPPLSAVEDLVVIMSGQLPPVRAAAVLTEHVRCASAQRFRPGRREPA
jgi:hypothetical protein